MKLDSSLVKRIKTSFASLSSEELQGILTRRDTGQWSDEAFEAALQLLKERELGTAIEPGVLSPDDNLWQDTKRVVLRSSASFPSRCVICNKPLSSSPITIINFSNPELILNCQICQSHARLSTIAKAVHQLCLIIWFASFFTLFSLVMDIPGGWKTRAGILSAALCWGLLAAIRWKSWEPQMQRGGSLLVQVRVVSLGCFALPFLFGFVLYFFGLLARAAMDGYYLLFFLCTVPPIAGFIFLRIYQLRLSLSSSHSDFMTLEGAGATFRASLPSWPGYPKTTKVSSPREIGKRIYH